MNKLILFLSFSLFFFPIREISCQTIAGGEIYYELLSSKKYLVTAHIYRMCDKGPYNNISASVYGGTKTVAMNFQRIAISKINDTCGNPCNKQNATSNAGFERHTFIDTVDFNFAPYDVFVTGNICVVNFGVRQSGRTSALTTLTSGIFYLDASTDICLSGITKNTSPQFGLEPKFMAACNMPFIYSPGPLDTMDNDSFTFSLADVLFDYQAGVTYKGSFSSQIPMSPFCLPSGVINCKPLPNAKPPRGFYFDPMSCGISFTPSYCGEEGVIKYRIDEYRYNKQTKRHEWLGYVTREMTVRVVSVASNNFTGITGTSGYAVCEGNKLCFKTKSTDADTKDSTTMLWDKGIRDATLQIVDPKAREKEVELCWQTVKKGLRHEKYYFNVAAFDKKCNLNLTSRTRLVYIRPTPKYTYKNATGKCGQVKWTSTVYDSLYPNYSGTCYTVLRSQITSKVLYVGYGLIDSATIHENGKIIIEHTFNVTRFNCPVTVRDTLIVTGAVNQPDINNNRDSIICRNSLLPFKFRAYKIQGLKSFKWYLNDSLFNQADTSISLVINKNSKIKLHIENNGGCVAERTIYAYLKYQKVIFNTDKSFCIGDVVTINGNINSLKKPVTYLWKINGADTAVNDSNLVFRITRTAKVLLTVKDADKCVFADSVLNTTKLTVRFSLNGNKVCKDSITTVRAFNINGVKPFTYKWQVNGKDTSVNDSVLFLRADKEMAISLKVKDMNDCISNDSAFKDSILIKPVNTPEVKLVHDIRVCYDAGLHIIPVISNRPPVIDYVWTFNKAILSIDSVFKGKFTSAMTIKLKVSNRLQCSTEDTVNIKLYPRLTLLIDHNINYHPSSLIILSTNNIYPSYQWFNNKTTRKDSFYARDLGAPGKYKVWCRTIDSNGCVYTDTAEIFTDKFLGVDRKFLHEVSIYPNPVEGVLTIEAVNMESVILFSSDARMLAAYGLFNGISAIDMTPYASGIYFIKVTVNGEGKIYKVIKE